MMLAKSYIGSIALALTLAAGTARAVPAYLNGYIETMAEAVEACTAHFPDMSAVNRAMRASSLDEVQGGLSTRLYEADDAEVIAVVISDPGQQRCMFGVDGLYDGNAEQTLRALVAKNGGRFIGKLDESNFGKAQSVFLIEASGRRYVVGVSEIFEIPHFYRGSLLMLRSAN